MSPPEFHKQVKQIAGRGKIKKLGLSRTFSFSRTGKEKISY